MTINVPIKERQLDITVIIDKSGSMEEIRDDAIGAFNAFLSDRKSSDPDALMTIVLFDDQYEVLINGMPIKDVHPFHRETYVTRGNTALLDAVGRTVSIIQERPHQDDSVLIAILTDGMENASKEWTGEQIQTLITSLENKGWDFYYLSASLNAFADGKKLGIKDYKNLRFKKEVITEAYSQLEQALLEKKMLLARKRDDLRDGESMYQ